MSVELDDGILVARPVLGASPFRRWWRRSDRHDGDIVPFFASNLPTELTRCRS